MISKEFKRKVFLAGDNINNPYRRDLKLKLDELGIEYMEPANPAYVKTIDGGQKQINGSIKISKEEENKQKQECDIHVYLFTYDISRSDKLLDLSNMILDCMQSGLNGRKITICTIIYHDNNSSIGYDKNQIELLEKFKSIISKGKVKIIPYDILSKKIFDYTEYFHYYHDRRLIYTKNNLFE